jgi:succinate dehydrogenase/fumarate reductase flavoprotein subunit
VDHEVIVLGGGGAGLAAAVTAQAAGARVLLVEAGDHLGGSTAMSAGVFYAAGTSVQRAAGVFDDVERMFRYYMAINQWVLEPGLVMRYCTESAPTLEWLLELGVKYPSEMLYVSGVDDTARGHQCVGGGAALIDVLAAHAGSLGVEVRLDTRVEQLVVADDAVRGAMVGGVPTSAGAVVLATGGFGANPALLAEYFPPALQHGPRWTNYFGSPTSRGDGIDMTRELGADVVGRGWGMLNWTAGFTHEPADFCPPWIVFVNLDGHRFMAEDAAYAVAGNLMDMQREARCFAVLDEGARASSDDSNERRDKLGVGQYTWSGKTILAKYREGRVLRADTLEELAAQAGIDAAGLRTTIARYNADARRGFDSAYRKAGPLREVKDGPFYAVEVRASTFGNTFPGLRIDQDARVKDTAGATIPGLYAAGEAAGGVMGTRYVGGGNAVGSAVIFGRLAGRAAAQEAQARPGRIAR